MVVIDSSTTTSLFPQTRSSSLPLVASPLKSSVRPLNVRSIILSAAGVGICIALGLFVLICWKVRKSILWPAEFIVQTKLDTEEKNFNQLKPLEPLSPKTQILAFEKCTLSANADPQSNNTQFRAPCFPYAPGSPYLDRLHRSRQQNPAVPVLPLKPKPAFTLNLIPVLCSPPSTSPKEIFEWIQSDSVLSSHDGYAYARQDTGLCMVSPETEDSSRNAKTKPTYSLAQEARISSMFSPVLNKTSSRGPFIIGNLSSSNRIHHQHHQHLGAARISSISHLDECHLGPLEQGIRWGSLWHTLEKPIPSRLLKGSPHRLEKRGNEN